MSVKTDLRKYLNQKQVYSGGKSWHISAELSCVECNPINSTQINRSKKAYSRSYSYSYSYGWFSPTVWSASKYFNISSELILVKGLILFHLRWKTWNPLFYLKFNSIFQYWKQKEAKLFVIPCPRGPKLWHKPDILRMS